MFIHTYVSSQNVIFECVNFVKKIECDFESSLLDIKCLLRHFATDCIFE